MTDTDEFLAHYGVKGMKWGVSRSKNKTTRSGAPMPSLNERRKMNKVARAENRAKAANQQRLRESAHDKSVLAARARLDKDIENYHTAKKEYKAAKREIGRVAAKRVLEEPGRRLDKTYAKASELTTKELKQAQNQEAMIAGARVLASMIRAAG